MIFGELPMSDALRATLVARMATELELAQLHINEAAKLAKQIGEAS